MAHLESLSRPGTVWLGGLVLGEGFGEAIRLRSHLRRGVSSTMMKTRQQRAAERKWYARMWWVAFHVYDYAALAFAGVLSPQQQGTGEFVTCVAVALLNLGAYIRLQTSSPGFVSVSHDNQARDLEGGRGGKNASEASADTVEESDIDLLVPATAAGEAGSGRGGSTTTTRFCEDCQVMQPMRTKHCKDCDRCVRQYDHHCDCAGTCVGLKNRRFFIFYLFIQMVEAFQMIGVAVSAFTMQSSVDDWLVANMPFIVAWFSIFVVLLITIPLLGYQLFLISSNQTSWEHARRSAITYLQHLRDDKSPFDRGVVRNWWIFLTGGDSDVWVHPTAKPQHSPLPHDQDDTSIM